MVAEAISDFELRFGLWPLVFAIALGTLIFW
jgi:hypothetical protein